MTDTWGENDAVEGTQSLGGDWGANDKAESASEPSGLTRRLVGDTGVSVMKGLARVPEGLVGIADIATGGQAGKAVADAGIDFKGTQDYWADMYSPEQKLANESVAAADGFVDKLGAIAESPSVIPHAVVESLPSMFAGGVVGKAAKAVGAVKSSLAAGAIGEGAMMGGSAAESIRQQAEDGLLTGKQQLAALGTGLVGGALGAGGAAIGKRLGLGDVDTALVDGAIGTSTRSMPARIAGGAAQEGLLEEMPQSMAETALENYALDRDIGQGVGAAAAMGLVTGGAMGAGFGALSGQRPQVQPTPTPENPNPAPVDRPDPSNGPLSAAAFLLPAPDARLGLPAPESVLFADSQGTVSDQGPARDVDREYRPTGREQGPQTFGAGMDQQTERGAPPALEGDYIAGSQSADGQLPREINTIDGQLAAEPRGLSTPQPRLADGRADAGYMETNTAGESRQAKTGNVPPKDYVPQGGRGMDQPTPVGQKYSNPIQAKNAIQKAGAAATHEAVQTGPKQFEVRPIAAPAEPVTRSGEPVTPSPEQPATEVAAAAVNTAAPAAQPPALPTATPAKPQGARKIVDRDRDTVAHAVMRLGGISIDNRQDTTGETRGNSGLPGIGYVWSKGGTGLDEMASKLNEQGFVPAGEMNNLGGVPWLQSVLGDHMAGRKEHFAPGSARQEEESAKQEAQRYADIAQQAEGEGRGFDSAPSALSDLLDADDLLEIRAAAAAAHAAELDAIFEDHSDDQSGSTEGASEGTEQAQQAENSTSRGDGSEQQSQGGGTNAPGNTAAEAAFDLTQQTEASAAADAAAQAERDKAEAAKQKKLDDAKKKADNLAAIKAANTKASETFELGQNADDNLSGQGGMFDSAPSLSELRGEITKAADAAATSPNNDLAEPTDKQKEAGNYQKGHVSVQGLDLAIENPKGSVRSGTGPSGKAWSHTMSDHYGYIKRTEGADGDHVDIYLGSNPLSEKVFVVDQVNADGTFDEHKVMLGFDNQLQATNAYSKNFDKGWKVGKVTGLNMDSFKAWLADGDQNKPMSASGGKPDQAGPAGHIEPPKVDANEFPLKEAQASYSGISHSGTSRGKADADEFAAFMGVERDAALAIARTDAQRAAAEQAAADLAGEYVQRYRRLMNVRAGTYSGFVAGRSGLNSKQADRRNDALTNTMGAFDTWKKGATGKVRQAVLDARTPDAKRVDQAAADQGRADKAQRREDRDRTGMRTILSWKKGGEVSFGKSGSIVGVSVGKDGYPTSIKIKPTDGGVLDDDKFDLAKLFRDSGMSVPASKQRVRDLVDAVRAEDAPKPTTEAAAPSEKLPEASFMDPSLPVNTGVNARMAVMDKPSVSEPAHVDEALFSRRRSGVAGAASAVLEHDAVKAVVERINARLNLGTQLLTYRSEAELFAAVPEIERQAERDGAEGQVNAVYYSGKVHVVTSAFVREADVEKSILDALAHEGQGHYGIRALFGGDTGAIDAALRELFAAIGGVAGVQRLAAKHGVDMSLYVETAAKMKERPAAGYLADELLAHLQGRAATASLSTRAMTAINAYLGAVREWLRSHGFINLAKGTDADIAWLLKRMREASTVTPGRRGDSARFSRSAKQTATDAFKRWFGGSKVVDAGGEPLVVYHGTTSDFSVFAAEAIGSNIVLPVGAPQGFYFAKSRDIAGRYALGGGANVMPVFVSLTNPAPSFEQFNADPSYDGFMNKSIVVARNPKQIKSAIGNNGDFDPASPDIRYRLNSQPAKGIPLFSAKAIAKKLNDKLGLSVKVAATEADLPAELQAQIKRDGASGKVGGVFHNGQSYIIASNLTDTKHAVRLVLHEAIGHGGVQAVLGDKLGKVMAGIYRDMPAAIKRELEARYAGKLVGLSKAAREQEVAEEYVAHLAEHDPQNSVLERIVALIRKFIRDTFGEQAALKWSRNDIVQLLAEAKRAARNDGPRGGTAQMSGDADPAEALRIQQSVKGKSLLEVAGVMAQSKNPAVSTIAAKVQSTLGRLESEGVKLGFEVVHRGAPMPAEMANSRGFTDFEITRNGEKSIVVWINGADVTGYAGMEEEIILHELVHAATSAAFAYGRDNPNTFTGRAAQSLIAVSDAIAAHINQRFTDAESGKAELSDFEQSVRDGLNNAFATDDEVLAWALSSRDAQAYLEGIPYKGNTLWSRFVNAVRVALGMNAAQETALSEVLAVAEQLMSRDAANMAQYRAFGKQGRHVIQQASDSWASRSQQGGTRYRNAAEQDEAPALMEVSEADEAEFVASLKSPAAVTSIAGAMYKAKGTESPFFQRWFAKSKMVDRSGAPIAFVHRSFGDMSSFDDARLGSSTGTATAALGHFLARKDVGNVERYGPVADQFFIRMEKPKVITQAQFEAMGDWSVEQVKAYRAKAMQAGFDGMYVQGLAWPIVFEGKNIKGKRNTGTFDATANTRYSLTGDARDLFDRATGPAPLERDDPFATENRRLREGEKTLWQKAKKEFSRQFAPGGLLPDAVFAEKITRDSEFQAVEFDVRHLSGGLNAAVKADYGVELDNLAAEQMKPLAEALAGKVDAAIPEATKVAIVAMRQYIDSLSGEYLSILQKQVEANMEGADQALIDKITGNLGSYVNRSYQAFDDPKWFKTVPTGVVNAARVYLAKGYMEHGDTPAEAARLADVTVNEMLKTGTAYDSMGAFIAEGKLGAKDLTVLIKRKEIAPEIRALLGEYMDPRLNFAKSATKMGRMVWNQRFLDRVLEFGMGSLFFKGKDRPADATTQIAGDKSESYAPLNGLWTFPEVAQSFQDALGKEQMSDLYRTVVRLNGMVKYGKTILSPTTAMRNWQSAMFFSLANGHFDLSQMKHSWSAMREQVTQNATGDDLAYLRKLKQLGVVYDTPYAGEMMALLQDARMDELLSSKSGTGLKWLRKVNQFAQGFYSFGDDFWKIIGFENEKAGLIKAGIPEAQAETMAAERIRNTYPTYSMIGKAVQWLRRFPLMGTFVSFPSEIIRTTVNMMQLTAADLKSDNPGIRAIGRKRAAGMAMVSAGFYALSAMTAAALGVGDDEEEALRDLSAPWSRNSTFLYTGRDADGKLRYFDMSFLDPYGYWKRPLTAMMRDQPWEKAAASGISDMLSPFFGADITAGAIFEVLANKKPTGGQVYNANAGSVDQLQDISNHMRKALQPGFMSNGERLWLAGSDARHEGSGQPYDMRDEVVSLLGWRAATLDTQTGLYYRSFDFTDALSNAKKTLTRTLRSSNDVSVGDIQESKQAANAQYQKAFTEMGRLVRSAESAGMSRREVMQTLKLSGVAQRNIVALLNGRVPEMDIGIQAQAKAVKQAGVMRGSEHAAEIARRFRLAREQ